MKKVADPFGACGCVLRAEQIATQLGQAQTQLGMAVDQDSLHQIECGQHQANSQEVGQAIPNRAQKLAQQLLHRGG